MIHTQYPPERLVAPFWITLEGRSAHHSWSMVGQVLESSIAKNGSCHIVPAPYIFTAFDFALLDSQFGQIDTLAGGCFAMSDTFDASCRLPKAYECVKIISRFLMCVGVGVGVGVERAVGENLRTAEKKIHWTIMNYNQAWLCWCSLSS